MKSIETEVRDAAVRSVLGQLKKPSGRRPSEAILKLSAWFGQLSDGDRASVVEVIKMAANQSAFGFLCVLDGVRAIEDGPEKGVLKLLHEKSGQSTILNPETGAPLHELFQK